ncbi:MAG: hypothetical protein PHW63_07735 [Alphaproteobacteria bacterium]|nr:hypothetical protein [Alphaproteobacteria bacterium]
MKAGLGVVLLGLIVWLAIVFLMGAVLAWGSEGHLETIFEREIPFFNLWMVSSIALAFFAPKTSLEFK